MAGSYCLLLGFRYWGIEGEFSANLFTVFGAIALVVAVILDRRLDNARKAIQYFRESYNTLKAEVDEKTRNLVEVNEKLKEQIAERLRREIELRKSDELHRETLGSITEAIFITDGEGRFTYISPSVETVFGYTTKEVERLGRVDKLLTGNTGSNNPSALSAESRNIEFEIVDKRGESRFLLVDLKPVRIKEGRILYTCRDISDLKKAEEARRLAEERLRRQRTLAMRSDRLRSLGEMAAGIAHELNQPLVGVRGLAEHILIAMERGWDLSDEKIREKAQLIVDQADRMEHIIEHVRIFARESGKPESVSLSTNKVVRSAMEMLGAQMKSHGLILTSDLANDLPKIYANPFSLEEVLLNLLSNARDAVLERGDSLNEMPDTPHILVQTQLEEDDEAALIRVSVIDKGTGIPLELQEKVFDPFFTTKSPDKGTGLGLSVAKSIVESFGGKLDIQSVPGEGTTVSFLLPAHQAKRDASKR